MSFIQPGPKGSCRKEKGSIFSVLFYYYNTYTRGNTNTLFLTLKGIFLGQQNFLNLF